MNLVIKLWRKHCYVDALKIRPNITLNVTKLENQHEPWINECIGFNKFYFFISTTFGYICDFDFVMLASVHNYAMVVASTH